MTWYIRMGVNLEYYRLFWWQIAKCTLPMPKPSKVGIVGSRNFPDLWVVRTYVECLPGNTTVVSGGAIGVDRAAEEHAKRCGLTVQVFRADWAGLGRGAGYARNHTIVEQSDRIVAFWDGRSKGTAHTIRLTREAKKPLQIISPA
jgi:hypothetical protein